MIFLQKIEISIMRELKDWDDIVNKSADNKPKIDFTDSWYFFFLLTLVAGFVGIFIIK